MYNAFKGVFPDVEPQVFEPPVWTKALPAVHIAKVKQITLGGSQTAAIIATGELWQITPNLKEMLPFSWSRELHALVHTFPVGEDAPEFDTQELGWNFTIDDYDELEPDGQE